MSHSDINGGADPHALNSATEPTGTAQPDYKAAALEWFHLGLKVIPIVPLMKKTAVTWDDWLLHLSESTIIAYWTAHPTHEVGCIVGDEMIVFDADTSQAIVALAEIEKAFDITPSWVNKTRRGEHHFYRRAPGTYAKSDAHATADHPERIDIKTGRAMVILPPSTGKHVEIRDVEHVDELPEATQAFIDAVFRHNGRPEPRPAPDSFSAQATGKEHATAQQDLSKLLEHLTSDLPHDDWLTVLLAIHWAYGGSQEGFELADRWSATGKTYHGTAALFKRWQSFAGHKGAPVTIGSACKIAQENGIDLSTIPGTNWEDFRPTTTEILEGVETEVPTPAKPNGPPSPAKPEPIFSRYSLTGYSGELGKEVQEETFVLAPLALRGQATVWYAAPNAGKTLITLNRLICAIREGLVDPRQVFYLNADDTSQGLLLKVQIAERYGFNMLAPGHRDFDLKQLLVMLRQVCLDGTARQVVLVVDTLKKTTDLMDKQKASAFTRVVREFVSHGGTFLGLAHVNKKPGPTGKSVYAGTTDIKDDFDCAFVIDVIDNGRESGTRIVEFSNEKRRGTVADAVRFSYRAGNDVSYVEMLESVEMIETTEADKGVPLTAEEIDAEAISVVEHSIRAGRCKKTELLVDLRQHAGLSKRNGEALLVKYTGHVPTLSKWNYEVRDHGAHCYYLLNDPLDETNDADSGNEPQLIDVQQCTVLDF